MYGRVQPSSKRRTLREIETSSVSEWTEDELDTVMELEDERNRRRESSAPTSTPQRTHAFYSPAQIWCCVAALPLKSDSARSLTTASPCRCGGFQLAYPAHDVEQYTSFFSTQRRRNIILAKWMANPDWALLRPFMARAMPECAVFPPRCPLPSTLHTRGHSASVTAVVEHYSSHCWCSHYHFWCSHYHFWCSHYPTV